MRFLHIGDLHLASRFSAFTPRVAAAWREGQLAALEDMLRQARDAGAQLLLFAGDSFDTPTPDAETAHRFFSLLGDTELPVVIAPGNHDFYMSGGVFDSPDIPSNVHIFKTAELSSFAFPALGVTVSGYAFTAESMPAPTLPRAGALSPEHSHILLAHADLDAPLSAYAPLSGKALAASDFRYAALGHVHVAQSPQRFGQTVAAYSGFLAGRGFDEVGGGSANLVELDRTTLTVTPLAAHAASFEIRTLDCTGATSGEEIRLRAVALMEGLSLPARTALRLVLQGEVGVDCVTPTAALRRLGEGYDLFEIRDETGVLLDTLYLQRDPSLRGAFYRALLPRLESADAAERAVAAEALRLGLAAIAGKEVLL